MSQTKLICIYKNGTHTTIENCYTPHFSIQFALLFIIIILLFLYCSSPVPNSDDIEEPSDSSNQRAPRESPRHLAHPSVYANTIV